MGVLVGNQIPKLGPNEIFRDRRPVSKWEGQAAATGSEEPYQHNPDALKAGAEGFRKPRKI